MPIVPITFGGYGDKFEEKYDSVVYMVVRTFSNIGKMDSYLYVSDYREEWEYDNENIKNLTPPSVCL